MIIYCAQSMCFVRSIFACVSSVYYKTEESGTELNIKMKFVESIGRKNELNLHRWKENNVT